MNISINYKHLKPWSYLEAQKNIIYKNLPSLEVVGVVFVQCNLV